MQQDTNRQMQHTPPQRPHGSTVLIPSPLTTLHFTSFMHVMTVKSCTGHQRFNPLKQKYYCLNAYSSVPGFSYTSFYIECNESLIDNSARGAVS